MAAKKPSKKTALFSFGATGDIHVGLNVEELDRTQEALAALDAFIDYCIDRGLELAVIGGDVFDYNHPLAYHVAEVMRRLRRLDKAMIPTVVEMGNHDANADPEQVWAGRPFEEADYMYVKFVTEPCVLVFGEMRCMFVPHITKSFAQLKGFKTSQEFMETWMRQTLKNTTVDVAFCHLNVWCAKTGTEANMLRQSDLQLPAWFAEDDRVGIIINHHVHTPQEFGKVFLPGSPICTDFGDVEENKSFIHANLTDAGWEINRVATPQSPLQEFELDYTGKDAKAMAALDKQAVTMVLPDAIVKLRVLIEEERLAEVNDDALAAKFRKACRFVKQVHKVPVRRKAVRDEKQHAALSPKEAIDVYLSRAKPEGADRKRALAMQLLAGDTPDVVLPTSSEVGVEEELDAVLAKTEIDDIPVAKPAKKKLSAAEQRVHARDALAGVSLEV